MRGMSPSEMSDNGDGSRQEAHTTRQRRTGESFLAQARDGADAAPRCNGLGPCTVRRRAWRPAKGPATDAAKIPGTDATTGPARDMAPVGRWCAHLQVAR